MEIDTSIRVWAFLQLAKKGPGLDRENAACELFQLIVAEAPNWVALDVFLLLPD